MSSCFVCCFSLREEIWVREKEVCETGSPQIGVITEKANKSWNDDMKNNIRSAAPDVYFLGGEARIGGEKRLKGEERSEAER